MAAMSPRCSASLTRVRSASSQAYQGGTIGGQLRLDGAQPVLQTR